MPGINVSALSGGDLRRLLKVAHARHDGLLADTLEWEIAARATSGSRQAGPFATLPDDDQDEAVDHSNVSEPEPLEPELFESEPFEPELTAREPTQVGRSVLLVTLGAVAGSLLSASVFWGLGRMDGLPVVGRAQPQPTWTAVPAAPLADQTVAALTPEAQPLLTDAIAPAATPLPAATAPVEVAQKSEPAAKVHKKRVAAKPASHRKPADTQLAERTSRPPSLHEWLAKTAPEEPIH